MPEPGTRRRPPPAPRLPRGDESGMSVVEVVLWTPVLVGLIMLLVCIGYLIDARGSVQGAARDAARAGSLERTQRAAVVAAQQAANADLPSLCGARPTVVQVGVGGKAASFVSGGVFAVQVRCDVDLGGLNWFGLGKTEVDATSAAPIDEFRRTG